jgi:hypothetical protein
LGATGLWGPPESLLRTGIGPSGWSRRRLRTLCGRPSRKDAGPTCSIRPTLPSSAGWPPSSASLTNA